MDILKMKNEEFYISTDSITFLVLFAPALDDDGNFVSFAIDSGSKNGNWYQLYRLAWSAVAIDEGLWTMFETKPEAVGFYDRATEAAIVMGYDTLQEYKYIYSTQ